MNADVLAEAAKSVERVQQFDPIQLSRRDVLGVDFAFDAAVEPTKRVISLFEQIPITYLKDIPLSQLQQIKNEANAFYSQLESILSFSPATDGNPTQTRQSYIDNVTVKYDQLFPILYPLIAYLVSRQQDYSALERSARASMQAVTDEASELKSKLAADREEAQNILAEVRTVAAEQGVSQQASYFKDESDKHAIQAKHWRNCTVGTSIGLGLYAALSLLMHKIPLITPVNTYEAIQLSIGKVLIFAVIAYMLILCAKNFLSHTHNQIVNKHRQNALLTFKSLSDAARGEDKRDIVLIYAASCIFSPQDTGYTRSSATQDAPSSRLVEIIPKMATSGS